MPRNGDIVIRVESGSEKKKKTRTKKSGKKKIVQGDIFSSGLQMFWEGLLATSRILWKGFEVLGDSLAKGSQGTVHWLKVKNKGRWAEILLQWVALWVLGFLVGVGWVLWRF